MYENMEFYGPSEHHPEKCERRQFGGKPVIQALRTRGRGTAEAQDPQFEHLSL